MIRILGKTNLKVNEIGCGGIPVQRVTQDVVNEMIDLMISKHMNFIDTARGYTNSEELFGNALINKRDKFIIATKSMSRSYLDMKRDIKISLTNLKTSYIDLYQCHNVKVDEDITGALQALIEAKKQGIIHHIGITSHSLDFIKHVLNNLDKYPFETIQFPYNIVENQAEDTFKLAKSKNIGIIVMKPLAGGAIDDGKLAIKYILNNENISVVIPGMESVNQVLENSSVRSGKYTDDELEKISYFKKTLNNNFCRRCGYCMPCSVGINIPFVFLCVGYYTRYNLKEWGLDRYNKQEVLASKCIGCKLCEQRCPYHLPIAEKMKEAARIMEGNNEK